MKKLSKKQEEVIELMKKGWQLAFCRGWNTWATIQKGGFGYGGESRRVNINTLFSLEKRKLIVVDKDDMSTTYYKLADKTPPQKERRR